MVKLMVFLEVQQTRPKNTSKILQRFTLAPAMPKHGRCRVTMANLKLVKSPVRDPEPTIHLTMAIIRSPAKFPPHQL